MMIDKQSVLDHMNQMGVGQDQLQQAVQMLPDQIDHEQASGMLQQFGVDPQNLVNNLPGGLGGAVGGFFGQQGGGGQGQGGYDQGQQGGYDQGQQGGYDQGQQGGYDQGQYQ